MQTLRKYIFTTTALAALLGPAAAWPRAGGTAWAEADQEPLDGAKLTKVQAAFVLNFVKFTSWPRGAFAADNAPLVVAIVEGDDGDTGIASVFAATLNGRKLGDHAIQVRRIAIDANANVDQRVARIRELADVHVAFVVGGSRLTAGDVRAIGSSSVLTVAAPSADAPRGAMLSFGIEGGKVVFYYDADAARDSGLTLSSKLLALARPSR